MVKVSVNEVQQKIGRNMLLFQQLEYLLKHIVLNGNISGHIGNFHAKRAKQVETVSTQTLGKLVSQYIDDIHDASDTEDEVFADKDEAHISFKFRISSDSAYFETKKVALSRLVNERNELVHHFLPYFKPDSPDSCQEIARKLDAQSETVRHEINNLSMIVKSLDEGRKNLLAFISSEEGKKNLELQFIQGSRLVVLLQEIAEQVHRDDGWTLLSIAGQLLKQHASEEITLLKQTYGHKTLKSLVIASEVFDVRDERTDNGGVRVLYRLKTKSESRLKP
ncbi:OST-HTH/LOTUS domain-containing protein [Alteromonas ponticola]|uniref:HTH OST-type domain-containing protein n=1 Tax=Alteromonas ponticola TaxID=2720613 RepID=A0ABX1R717_9ALTE|nr:OST-HTH/LOTUS domain-containing protein [Alteromonas ponticola]NMH61015.1 hypothetical protein [Alteromonas ponticola]